MHHTSAVEIDNPWYMYAAGDDAVTVDFGNTISQRINQQVIQLCAALQTDPMPGMVEAVPAYSTLSIYYDMYLLRNKTTATQTIQQWMMAEMEKRIAALPITSDETNESINTLHIPVCYDTAFSPDMEAVCSETGLSPAAVVQLHTSQTYRVYMTGFLPGFAYMGETAEQLHVARKQKPVPVAKGSVGLAGKQTGIYPADSPGGWQIIGRTPLVLFNASQRVPVLLKPGDAIQFYTISSHEFADY